MKVPAERIPPLLADAIKRHPPLSRADEHALAVRVRAGDVQAKQKLISHNLAYVLMVAFKAKRGRARLEDVVQEGMIGLALAADKFDPDAGTRFGTYAAWWIRAYIGKHIQVGQSVVRPKANTHGLGDSSLDAPLQDGGETTFAEAIPDAGPGADERLAAAGEDLRVRGALASVRGRLGRIGRAVVEQRLTRDDPRTLEEVGADMGVSRERVRQVEVNTVRFLRQHLDREGFAEAPLTEPPIRAVVAARGACSGRRSAAVAVPPKPPAPFAPAFVAPPARPAQETPVACKDCGSKTIHRAGCPKKAAAPPAPRKPDPEPEKKAAPLRVLRPVRPRAAAALSASREGFAAMPVEDLVVHRTARLEEIRAIEEELRRRREQIEAALGAETARAAGAGG